MNDAQGTAQGRPGSHPRDPCAPLACPRERTGNPEPPQGQGNPKPHRKGNYKRLRLILSTARPEGVTLYTSRTRFEFDLKPEARIPGMLVLARTSRRPGLREHVTNPRGARWPGSLPPMRYTTSLFTMIAFTRWPHSDRKPAAEKR